MNYIVFDLEWNNGYSYAHKSFVNEIIEIGALKLNDRLEVVDTFKQFVKPSMVKKLSSRCKNLTNITNEELRENGIPFSQAIKDFSRWSNDDDNVFLSWSNSDLYVLTSNYRFFINSYDIEFINNYCDAQKYCMSFIENTDNNQISLAKCGESFGIDIDTSKLHRALSDCYLTTECLKKVFDKDKINKYIVPCGQEFFERLVYKPYIITTPKSDLFNVYEQNISCPKCGDKMRSLKTFECINKSFRCPTKCDNCNKTFWTTIRAKKTYDKVEVYTRSIEMNKKRARKIK